MKGSSPHFSRQQRAGAVEQSYAHVPFVKTIFALSCQRSSALDIGSRRNDRLINLSQNFGHVIFRQRSTRSHRFGTVYGGRYRGDLAQLRPLHLFAAALLPYLSVLDLMLNAGRDSLAVLST